MKTENDENASAIVVVKPGEMMRLATDVAGVCRDIVTKTAITIQNKKYVRVEGWQSIAIAYGCVAGSKDVERIEGGVKAVGEIRRQDNGTVIATAEGFVGDDEKTWGKMDEYAKRAMAQTRAISRACRSAFAHVVVLMDAGLSTTPAEEVPNGGFPPDDKTIEARQERREAEAAKAPSGFNTVKGEMTQAAKVKDWRDATCTYGKKDGPLRGKQLGELTDNNLKFLSEKFLHSGLKVDEKDQLMTQALAQRELQMNKFAQNREAEERSYDSDEIPGVRPAAMPAQEEEEASVVAQAAALASRDSLPLPF
jgi:hypothetical protein